MKTKNYKYYVFFLLILITGIQANGEDLRKIASLSGQWKFSIGDDIKWADPSFNDSGWDQISVPADWESQGYDDYNGYAWYRKTFTIREVPANTTIYLLLGRIDDADVVYLNGQQVGKSGKFPPDFKTSYDVEREYIINPALLRKDAENVISVKVYDSYMNGGITDGRVGIYIDEDDNLLDLNLSGQWKFHLGNDKNWKSADINDDDWKTITVPSTWENEGYEDYDGYAWYRLEFKAPQNLSPGDLYLSLGKIDDLDDVYLNGEYVGNVHDLRRNTFSRGTGGEYNTPRIYKIPEGSLKRNGMNVLAVRVYDGQGLGGIYQGPIGIMSAQNGKSYRSRHSEEGYGSFWDYMYDKFFGNDN
jgi:hypothetical protein